MDGFNYCKQTSKKLASFFKINLHDVAPLMALNSWEQF